MNIMNCQALDDKWEQDFLGLFSCLHCHTPQDVLSETVPTVFDGCFGSARMAQPYGKLRIPLW